MAMPHVDSDSFWKKVRATAGIIPFADEVVAMWYAAWDPRTPTKVKAIVLGALAYFILPFDIVPDFIVGLGYGDDLAILWGAIRAVRPHVTDEHRARARAALKSET
ncbi:MAG TPA: YkvA family protein, partial [Candidatus Omnitrophota bacterium]|nr:YkvA family protein [Candidatus Omnitrophota bacterium]